MLTATDRGAASARSLLELGLGPSCFDTREDNASEPRLLVTLLLLLLMELPPLLRSLASCTRAAAVFAGGETRLCACAAKMRSTRSFSRRVLSSISRRAWCARRRSSPAAALEGSRIVCALRVPTLSRAGFVPPPPPPPLLLLPLLWLRLSHCSAAGCSIVPAGGGGAVAAPDDDCRSDGGGGESEGDVPEAEEEEAVDELDACLLDWCEALLGRDCKGRCKAAASAAVEGMEEAAESTPRGGSGCADFGLRRRRLAMAAALAAKDIGDAERVESSEAATVFGGGKATNDIDPEGPSDSGAEEG